MRDIAVIQTDLIRAEATLKGASQARDDLRRELREAQVEAAKEKGHPWLGKKLKRVVPSNYGNKTTTQQGVLTIYDPLSPDHRGLRGFYASSNKPGDLFVISASGKTGYRFYSADEIARMDKWSLSGADRVAWELA